VATSVADVTAALAKGKAATSKPKLTLSSSKDIPFWGGFRMMVLSAYGEGKTHYALTGSRFYPHEWPAKEHVELEDIVLLETDSSGLIMLEEGNVSVPRILDFTAMTDAEMFSVFMDIPAFLADVVAKAPTRLAVIDTASVLFQAVNTVIQTRNEGPKGYNEFAFKAREWMSKLKKVPVPVLLTAHIKPPKVIMDKNGTFYKEDSAVASGTKGRLPFDLEGNKGANQIRAALTLTGRLVSTEQPGGAKKREVRFNDTKTEGKMRLSVCVNEVEPAHLGALLTKIAQGCEKPMPEEQ
jgi:hypothetical protein